jgi:two-component system NtrC family sensor kinase
MFPRFCPYLSLFILLAIPAGAQQSTPEHILKDIESMRTRKDHAKDTAYLALMARLANTLSDSNPDSSLSILPTLREQSRAAGYRSGEVQAIKYMGSAWLNKGNYEKAGEFYRQAYQLADKYGLKEEKASIVNNQGTRFMMEGNYSEALIQYYQAIREAEASGIIFIKEAALNNIAIIYFFQGNFEEAERTYIKTLDYVMSIRDTFNIIRSYNNLAETNLEQNKINDAYLRIMHALELLPHVNNPYLNALVNTTAAFTFMAMDSLMSARYYFSKALQLADMNQLPGFQVKCLSGLAKLDLLEGHYDSAKTQALKALNIANEMRNTQLKRDINLLLSSIYESGGDTRRSLYHFKAFKNNADSLNTVKSRRDVEELKAKYSFSKKELEFRLKATKQKWIIFSSLAALLTSVVILFVMNRNRNKLNVTNHALQQKNMIIEAQRAQAEASLILLQETQAQLVHAEKMASLGALTAGIAHEIQNPLNFVKNFSVVNSELTDEITELLKAGRYEEAAQIAEDLCVNHSKIIEHGKRAQSIVDSMLQHSRKNTATKDWMDINKIALDNLKLSYHEMQLKVKGFHAMIDNRTDPELKPVFANTQEIGRVVINLCNNAFQAVGSRQKVSDSSYQPRVTLTTGVEGKNVFIRVMDNGAGIPEKDRSKIFQPFFTTKKTGEGTGLGLSLSYDIITKSHRGQMFYETKEGEGTTFTVFLPTSGGSQLI